MGHEKEKSGNSTFLTVLLVVLIVALIGALLFTLNAMGISFQKNESGMTFSSALDENNYQAAYTIYANSTDKNEKLLELGNHLNGYFEKCLSDDYTNEVWTDYKGIEIFNADIQNIVLDKMDQLVVGHYNGEHSEENVKKYLLRISKFSFTKEKYNDCIEQVNNKDASDKAYADGIDYYNNGQMEDAVKSFKKVSPKDSQRYPLAQDALLRIRNEWGAAKLSEAQKMVDAYNKEGARELLEKLIDVFGKYEEAEQMLLTLEPELEG